MADRFLYIFLDEAGNLDFSANGSRYFILSSITKERPFKAYQELTELKYNLVELNVNVEYFHAAEDTQTVRNLVFEIIQSHLTGVRIDSLIVEKRKTASALQHEERFYPEMLGYLLRYILNGHNLKDFSEVIVFTDSLPIQKKRRAIEKAVKLTLAKMLPQSVKYRVLHHASKSNMDLQLVDYCNWAIYRKWSSKDERSYIFIKDAIVSEFDIFESGTTLYY
jgi:hypothetical protein